MWEKVEKKFARYPSQLKVVRKFLEYGIRIEKNKMWCGNIEMSLSKVARAIKVDRKVVISAVSAICRDKLLSEVFSKLKPVCHVGEAAKIFNYGVVEIYAQPEVVGIVAEVSREIAKAGISIRQVIADDPDLSIEPKLTIITEKKIPGTVIEKLTKSKTVEKILVA